MREHKINGLVVMALSKAFKGIHNESLDLFRENNITFSQFAVLEALYTKGFLTIQEIIDVVLTTSGNMTVVIKNLEKNGLVVKETNPKDKRSYVISLTPKGRELIKSIFPEHMKILTKRLDVLTKEEKDTLLATLKKLY